ncbi:hypothetical protein BpHYR1_053536 [Brachionus plicatilis]|uniref:Uncharacterized protein n=1 Tax=Brachionus plicatilis TaxID=10195 RepID=A0A3M7PCR3_BRAPC|nr:hypothetical protein BpHYR1_053536 [Brachionus plicatilis]
MSHFEHFFKVVPTFCSEFSLHSSRACAQTLLKQPSASLGRRSSRACAQTLLKPYPSEIEKITLKTIIGHF